MIKKEDPTPSKNVVYISQLLEKFLLDFVIA